MGVGLSRAGQRGMLTPRLGAHPGGLLAQVFGTFLNIKLDACSPNCQALLRTVRCFTLHRHVISRDTLT